jgi:hypothetical protein
MMQMLRAGGIEVVTYHIRNADTDNPWGYWEYERVKKTKQDPSWPAQARGKAVKMVRDCIATGRWTSGRGCRREGGFVQQKFRQVPGRQCSRPGLSSAATGFTQERQLLSGWLAGSRHPAPWLSNGDETTSFLWLTRCLFLPRALSNGGQPRCGSTLRRRGSVGGKSTLARRR